MKFSMTGQEKRWPCNRGDCMGRFDYIVFGKVAGLLLYFLLNSSLDISIIPWLIDWFVGCVTSSSK